MRRTNYILLLIVAFAGCRDGERMFDVKGTVKFSDGKPVTGELATIIFQPAGTSNSATKSASGSIDADGSFRLMTNQPDDGAYGGDYRVVLKVWENYRGQKLAVPDRYTEAATSPLEATVSSEQTEFNFSIEK